MEVRYPKHERRRVGLIARMPGSALGTETCSDTDVLRSAVTVWFAVGSPSIGVCLHAWKSRESKVLVGGRGNRSLGHLLLDLLYGFLGLHIVSHVSRRRGLGTCILFYFR